MLGPAVVRGNLVVAPPLGIMELPFCAIDYAHARDGSIVVWEANPHPLIPEPWVSDEAHLRRFVQAMAEMLLADKNGVSATCALP